MGIRKQKTPEGVNCSGLQFINRERVSTHQWTAYTISTFHS